MIPIAPKFFFLTALILAGVSSAAVLRAQDASPAPLNEAESPIRRLFEELRPVSPVPASGEAGEASSAGKVFSKEGEAGEPVTAAAAMAEVEPEAAEAEPADVVLDSEAMTVEAGEAEGAAGNAGDAPSTQAAAYPTALEKAVFFHERGDYEYALEGYLESLNDTQVRGTEKRRALFGMAEAYYDKGAVGKAISLLDQYLKAYPEEADSARLLFQMGLMYREIGLYSEAVVTFYRVLNSIVVTGDAEVERYLQLARRAQFEIARSHFDAGEFEQALSLLERIELFELNPRDRETVLYYKAKAFLKTGHRGKGLIELNRFLLQFPESALVSEMLYEKAEAQMRMQRSDDALATLMELLERGGLPEENASANWRQWRRIAGNYFSNQYYERGDYMAALRLYQGIVTLDDDPRWQLPVVLQMGLCFEQLAMYDRAEESLRYVVQGVEALREGSPEAPLEDALEHLLERTRWRLDMIVWRASFDPVGLATAEGTGPDAAATTTPN